MDIINSAAMMLDFFEELNDFVKEQEAKTAGRYQEDCDHFV
jgi:hypothetical protein